MKKILFITAIMLLTTLSATAQYKDFYFGLKTGPSLQWAGSRNKTVHNEKIKVGYNVGFVAEFYFVENYAIETGLNLNLLRGHYSFSEPREVKVFDEVLNTNIATLDSICGNVDRMMRGTYVEIPVMLKMRTNEFGDWRFFGEVGASVGVRCKAVCKDSFEYSIPLTSDKYYENDEDFIGVADQYNIIQMNYIVAAGSEYSINGSTRTFARLVFNGGILNTLSPKFSKYTNTTKDENNEYHYIRLDKDKLDVHSYSIALELGIMF